MQSDREAGQGGGRGAHEGAPPLRGGEEADHARRAQEAGGAQKTGQVGRPTGRSI